MNNVFLMANGSDGPTDECQTALDCIFESSDGSFEVLKLCYIDVREYAFCDCSSWYGFTGADCDQPSFQTRYFTSILVFFLASGIVLLMFSVLELARHIWFIYSTSSRKASFNVGLAVLAANVGGALSVITYSSINLRALFDPSKFEQVQYNLFFFEESPDTTVAHGNLASSGLILANEFFIVAAMQISLSWIDVATDVWKFFDKERQKKVKRIERFIQMLTLVSLFGVFSFLVARHFYAATFICIISAILLLSLFVYGRWIFIKLVNGIFQEGVKESLLKVVVLVKHSSFLHIICLGGLMTMITLYYATSPSIYTNVAVGGFNYALLFRDLSVLLGLVIQAADTYYVHNLFIRLRKAAGSGKPSTATSDQLAKNRRKQEHVDNDSTERTLNREGANNAAPDVTKTDELPVTASLVRRKHSISDPVDGLFDDQSKNKTSVNTIQWMRWEV